MVKEGKMAKSCIYCSAGIAADSVVDICKNCMYQVWGEKMAKAIVENMEKERGTGNLELGRVGETNDLSPEIKEKMEIVEFEDRTPEGFSQTSQMNEPETLEGVKLTEIEMLD